MYFSITNTAKSVVSQRAEGVYSPCRGLCVIIIQSLNETLYFVSHVSPDKIKIRIKYLSIVKERYILAFCKVFGFNMCLYIVFLHNDNDNSVFN